MDGYIKIGTELDTKSFDAQIKKVTSELEALERSYETEKGLAPFKGQEDDLKELELEIEKTKNKLIGLQKKQAELDKQGLSTFEGNLGNIGNSIENIINKVARWTLAVFGVRTAYNAISSAVSTLTQYDEKMASNIEYIKYALANALKPVIEGLIQLVFKLLTYVNYLAKAWFGVDLFAKSSAKSFKAAKDGLKSTNKEAKALNKTLAGFDEMNILQKNGSTAQGGGGGGAALPDYDLSKMDVPIPKWLEWIKNNGKTIAKILLGIAAALLAFKFAKFISGIAGAVSGLSALKAGAALVVAGILLLVGSIVNLIFNWDKMDSKQKALAISLAVLGAAFITFGYAIATGLSAATLGTGLLIAGVVAGITAIGSLIAKVLTQKSAILSVKDANEQLKKSQEDLKNATNDYIDAIDRQEETQKALKEAQDKTGLSGEDLYKKVQAGTLDYKNMTAAQKEVYKAYLNNKDAQEQVKTATNNLTKAQKAEQDASWDKQLALAKEKKNYGDYKDAVVKAYKDGKISAEDAKKYISKAMTGMSDSSRKTFTKDLPDDIKEGLDPKKYEKAGDKFKRFFSNIWDGIKSGAKGAADWIKNKLGFEDGGVVYSAGGGGGKGSFATGGVVTKLATGAVINQPGRGVPVNSAIAGERGQEGIIPLTDSQMMSALGEAIGKYITINANITNTMNGRVIGRELQKIQGSNDFAMNR